jgi:hypothetical protein
MKQENVLFWNKMFHGTRPRKGLEGLRSKPPQGCPGGLVPKGQTEEAGARKRGAPESPVSGAPVRGAGNAP